MLKPPRQAERDAIRPRHRLVVLALVAWAVTSAASAEPFDWVPFDPPAHDATRTLKGAHPGAMWDQGYRVGILQAGLAAAGLAVFAWGVLAGRTGRRARLRCVRIGALVVLAAAAFGSYDHFSLMKRPAGIEPGDTFVYYIGSKYFRELGYFGVYDCTVAALVEQQLLDPVDLDGVRDLRSMRVLTAETALARGQHCRRNFTPTRWSAFKADLLDFHRRAPRRWARTLHDAGYHPPPVWSLLGGLVSHRVRIGDDSIERALSIDGLLIAGSLVGIGVAAGVEAAAVAALFWGTGALWKYSWVGDLYLRHTWLAALVLGLATLFRRRHLLAGFLLGVAALVRAFPAIAGVAFALRALRQGLREGRVPPDAARVAAGAALAAILLVPASLLYAGRGPDVYAEFAEKIGTFSTIRGANSMGLSVLIENLPALVSGSGGLRGLESEPPAIQLALRGLHGAVVLVFVFLFWKALGRADPLESAVLGLAMIPVLSRPTNYYYLFFLVASLLVRRRPRTGIWLLGAGLAWIVNGLVFYWEYTEYVVASIIALLLSLALLLEVWLGQPIEPASESPSPEPECVAARSQQGVHE
jgi:hypothetical protein